MPRITRSVNGCFISQSNLAGYRAVIDSIFEFESGTNDDNAAGTVPAAKAEVIGAGVAGFNNRDCQKIGSNSISYRCGDQLLKNKSKA